MNPSDLIQSIERVIALSEEVCSIASTAERNKHSLKGKGYYASKFADLSTELRAEQQSIELVVRGIGISEEQVEDLFVAIDLVISQGFTSTERLAAARDIRHTFEGYIIPLLLRSESPALPGEEPVLPSKVVDGTRGYLERMVVLANGCYVNNYFEPCGVMLRKIIESLIIAVYEHLGRASELHGNDGNYQMLNGLISIISNDVSIQLSRDTKVALPLIKQLGDRSAHNRHFLARKKDVDHILPSFRVAVDDLLHLAGLR